jgi:rRNA maturation RNase YbeY
VLSAIGEGRSELSIALVDDPQIRELNSRWRNRNRSTDVLSFSQIEGDFADHRSSLLGDVVISVETAAARAASRHRGLDEIITRLLVHGVLHLIGHDHEKDEEALRMAGEERRIWRELNE